jgi:two-component system LytT family response regulator
MKKVKCLLVDDEPLGILLLRQHIEQVEALEVVGECPNALKALEVLRGGEIDLLFLDIRMPALSGLELLKMLKQPPGVIITTAYREYALEGYDLDIVDYLLKPITFDRFLKAVERYFRVLGRDGEARRGGEAGRDGKVGREGAMGRTKEAGREKEDEGAPTLFVKSGYRTVKVGLDTILYMESLKDYVKIHLRGEAITTKYKISEMEADLGAENFLRIHRSFIVNIRHVTAYTASQVEIGGVALPIGESYKELVMKVMRGMG